MFDQIGFMNGLSTIPLLSSAKTRSICAENPTGAKGAGALAEPDPNGPCTWLGKGWKANPCIAPLPKGVTELANIEGPGVIQHIWMTAVPESYRNCILRMYWDGEETPSVEVPMGDFFNHGSTIRHTVNSPFMARRRDGTRVLSAASLAGFLAGHVVSASTWYPAPHGARDGLKHAGVSLVTKIGKDVLKEFRPRRSK
jgi:hypothetical protein